MGSYPGIAVENNKPTTEEEEISNVVCTSHFFIGRKKELGPNYRRLWHAKGKESKEVKDPNATANETKYGVDHIVQHMGNWRQRRHQIWCYRKIAEVDGLEPSERIHAFNHVPLVSSSKTKNLVLTWGQEI